MKILIVEDDTYISEMLCQLLGHSGYEPIAAYSGTEALLPARTDKATTAELLRMGADDYIAKPFNNDELLARSVSINRRSG